MRDGPQAYAPAALARELVAPGQPVLFLGKPGSGKSTLVTKIADALVAEGRQVTAICADPGSPVFGPPGSVSLGSVSLGRRATGGWQVERLEALATLDAGRFRLPLISAVERLVDHADLSQANVLVDAPGVHYGVAARELVSAVASTVDAALAVIVGDPDDVPDLVEELEAAGLQVTSVASPKAASSPNVGQRARARTRRWEAYLADAQTIELRAALPISGAPPSLAAHQDWPGRLVGLLDEHGRTLGMGEVEKFNGVYFVLRTPVALPSSVRAVVARDARRNAKGLVRTDTSNEPGVRDASDPLPATRLKFPFTRRIKPTIELDPGGAMTARIGFADLSVVGGLFEDPSVYARLRHERRGLLFDLGEVGGIPPKLLHRVSDAFVTHAHFDHFSGFVDLLRRWVHKSDVCRVWGPPGLADQVEAMVGAFTWDRIGAGEGPVFEVGEFDGRYLQRTRIEAAIGDRRALDREPLADGLLLAEPRFRVRACPLEHGTTVLAYSLEETSHFAVRSDRLEGRYEPGPWLGDLKWHAAAGAMDEPIELLDGSTDTVGELAKLLLIEKPGEKIVYATDFADTSENRRRIVELARGASVLICESAYRQDDAELAEFARHLTTRACAEIARDAGVERLVPFHFSSRYETAPEALYAEILEVFPDVLVPEAIARRLR